MEKSERFGVAGILLNALLFLVKFSAGLMSNSLALISDALNSFADVFSSIIIYIALRTSNKLPDADHPFGHFRAEPIAGVAVAIFTGILGFEIARSAVIRLWEGGEPIIGGMAAAVLLVTILVKSAMAFFFLRNAQDRPALRATGIDSRNDVVVSTVALFGVAGSFFGWTLFDALASIFISLFIFYSGYQIARENVDFLMGKKPDQSYIDAFRRAALQTEGITGVNDIMAHYVGNRIHVEIHVEMDEHIPLRKAHDRGKEVQHKIEDMAGVHKAFIHIDPV